MTWVHQCRRKTRMRNLPLDFSDAGICVFAIAVHTLYQKWVLLYFSSGCARTLCSKRERLGRVSRYRSSATDGWKYLLGKLRCHRLQFLELVVIPI